MLSIKTVVDVHGTTPRTILEFMLNCTDQDYQRWWPGEHLAFHTLRRYPGDIGNLVYFDECVRIVHTLNAGFSGVGKIFDPLLRIFISRNFERDLELHAKMEFPKLAETLTR